MHVMCEEEGRKGREDGLKEVREEGGNRGRNVGGRSKEEGSKEGGGPRER